MANGGRPRVLDVGQCDPDHRRIAGFLSRQFGADVDRAHGLDDARGLMEGTSYRLVLVNRMLDMDYTPGLNVIKALKADVNPDLSSATFMLVSNYPEAQQEAVEAGAEPGFGKAQLEDPEVVRRVGSILA